MGAVPFGWQVENSSGTPVSGAKIYFYVPSTTTPRTTYTDSALTVPAANPVLADAAGWFGTYTDGSLAYDVVIKSADDAITYRSLTIPAGAELDDATLVALAGLSLTEGDYIEATGTDIVRARKSERQTYAALTAIGASARFDDMLVYVASRATDGDGGEGYWRFDASSSATANGGTILAPDSGTGRWIRQGVGTRIDALWFGVIADGSTNNSTVVQAAVTYAITTGRSEVLFPAGVSKFTGDAITATLTGQSGIAFVGRGTGITQILIDNSSGNGFVVTCSRPGGTNGEGNWWLNVTPSNSVSFRDMTIATNKVNTGTAIMIDGKSYEGRPGPPMQIENVSITGNDGLTECFAKGVDLLDVSQPYLRNVQVFCGGPNNFVGIGFDVRATDATTDPVQIVFDHCKVTYGNIAWQIGEYVEGIYLTQCDAINSLRGVQWVATAESGIHIIGGHYACYERCIRLVGVFDGTITGTLLYKVGSEDTFGHIVLDGGGSLTVIGNVMRGTASGTSEVGVTVANVPNESTHGISIVGNQFANMLRGISLASTARKVFVGENQFNGVTTPYDEGVAASAYFSKRSWSNTVVVTTVGGATSETFDVAIPAGQFTAKPEAGFAMVSGNFRITAGYDHDDAATTATNARFRMFHMDNTNITAAADYRFSILLSE